MGRSVASGGSQKIEVEPHTDRKKVPGPNNPIRNVQTTSEVFLAFYPKDHWTLKTGYFEDPTPAIQVQTLPLEGPRSLG